MDEPEEMAEVEEAGVGYLVVGLHQGERWPPSQHVPEVDEQGHVYLRPMWGLGDAVNPLTVGPFDTYAEATAAADELMLRWAEDDMRYETEYAQAAEGFPDRLAQLPQTHPELLEKLRSVSEEAEAAKESGQWEAKAEEILRRYAGVMSEIDQAIGPFPPAEDEDGPPTRSFEAHVLAIHHRTVDEVFEVPPAPPEDTR